MRLIFRVSSIAGLCLGLSRRTSRVRACFSRVHLAQKWAPKRTASGGFSFPPDDDEEFRGGRGKRVSRPPATTDWVAPDPRSSPAVSMKLAVVPRGGVTCVPTSDTVLTMARRAYVSRRDGRYLFGVREGRRSARQPELRAGLMHVKAAEGSKGAADELKQRLMDDLQQKSTSCEPAVAASFLAIWSIPILHWHFGSLIPCKSGCCRDCLSSPLSAIRSLAPLPKYADDQRRNRRLPVRRYSQSPLDSVSCASICFAVSRCG